MHHATSTTKVILIEKNKAIYDVWRYLQTASEAELLALPDLSHNESLDDYDLTHVQKKLISLFASPSRPPWRYFPKVSGMSRWTPTRKLRLVECARRVRDWTIIHGDYTQAPDVQATWFIDPPYHSTAEEEKGGLLGAGYGKEFGSARIGVAVQQVDHRRIQVPRVREVGGHVARHTALHGEEVGGLAVGREALSKHMVQDQGLHHAADAARQR